MSTRADAEYQRRLEDARTIELKCPRYVVIWGAYSRRFFCFGTYDGTPLEAESARGLLSKIQAEERNHPQSASEQRSPARPFM